MPAAGDFETWELLGRNAYGAVYRGVQFSLKRDVAIFELDAALRREAEQSPRFWDEVTQIAQLTDDALVSVYSVDRKAGWIVMELTAGNCGQLLARPQSVDVARSVLRQALSGLRRLHEAGRTHGDVRPPTLLIHRGGRVKLSFALGAALAGGIPYQRRDMKYVAPELVSPTFGEFGARSDLYCVGLAIVEVLLGPKFAERVAGISDDGDAAARTAWMRRHAEEAPLPSVKQLLPAVPDDFAAVLDKLLQKRVADRYASAADALAALAEAPLVPVIAPGVDPDAAGGPLLIGDVDKLHDPASRYDVAAAASADDAAAAGSAGGGKTSTQKTKQVAAPGKAGAGKKSDQKKKSNLTAILVGVAFAALVAFIVLTDDSGETPGVAPETTTAPPPATTLKLKPLERVTIEEDKIWTTKVELANPADAKGNVKFRLVSRPKEGPEMDVDGTLLWLPTEEQGPGEITIEYEAIDESTPPQTVRGSTTIVVAETNRYPALVVPVDPKVTVGKPFSVTLTATDVDVPANKVRLLIEAGPAGAQLDPTTGVLTWTPATAEPSTVEFKIKAEDDGTPPLASVHSFTAIIAPGNRPPTIETIAEQTVTLPYDAELGEPAVRLKVRAADPDDPGALPRFALVDPAPPGAKVDERTGEFTLQPAASDDLKPGTYAVTVEVFDGATPPASTKQTFQIVVKPAAP